MSLLIDALKKHRQETDSIVNQAAGNIVTSLPTKKVKKIIVISLITIIVITSTTITSFLIFKHLEKKRMAQVVGEKVAQAGKLKSLIADHAQGSTTGSAAPSELREKLQEKLAQKKQDSAATDSAATTDAAASSDNSTSSDTTSSDDAVSAASVTEAQSSSPRGGLRNRLADRKSTASAASGKQSSDATSTDANTESGDQSSSEASSDDASSTASMNTDSAQSDAGSSDTTESQAATSNVDIQVVPDQIGANNTTYQKALSFMQQNQYSQALSLLENNDDLLLQTQGLSAVLLARIYLSTEQYAFAKNILDHALMLHAGSDLDLIELKAQTLFMQKQYQEAVDLLSSQSPDLSTNPEYYSLLADAYMHLNQPANAASIFQQIVERFPDSASYWLGLSLAYQKSGDFMSALVAYRRAAQLSTDDPQVTLFITRQIKALQIV